MGTVLLEFGTVGTGEAHHIAGKLNHRHLHTEADAEIGNIVLPGEAHRPDLAFHPPLTKTTRDQDGVTTPQQTQVLLEVLGIQMAYPHLGAGVDAGVFQGLVEGLVGVQQIHVLAHHGDGDFPLRMQLVLRHPLPLAEVRRRAIEVEALHDELVKPPVVEVLGNAVNGVGVHQGHHGPLLDAGEQGDLAALTQIDFHLGATQQHIGLQADGAQLLH